MDEFETATTAAKEHQQRLYQRIAALEAEVARLRTELLRCGQDDCVGRALDGVARWVRAERLTEAQAEVARLREALEIVEFADNSGGEYGAICPWCKFIEEHAKNCERQAALRGQEAHDAAP